jgi:hypothetical protein
MLRRQKPGGSQVEASPVIKVHETQFQSIKVVRGGKRVSSQHTGGINKRIAFRAGPDFAPNGSKKVVETLPRKPSSNTSTTNKCINK